MAFRFVRATATGSGNGLSWTNAWSIGSVNSNQASINPGDTIWFAGGNYSSTPGFVLTKSGTAGNIITYKRVTAADQVVNNWADWQPGFDSQVWFSNSSVDHNVSCSFVTIDGQAGFTAANDFKDGFLSGPQGMNQGTMFGYSKNSSFVEVPVTNWTLRYFALVGWYKGNTPVTGSAGYGLDALNSQSLKQNILIQHCCIRGFCETLRMVAITSLTYDHCTFADTYNDAVDHEDISYTAIPSGNLVFKNCKLVNHPNDGIFFETGVYNTGTHTVTITGCFFYGCQSSMTENKTDLSQGPSSMASVIITNNIFACPQNSTNAAWVHYNNAPCGPGSRMQNNIFINCDHDLGGLSNWTVSNNAYSGWEGLLPGETNSFAFTYSAHLIKLPTLCTNGLQMGLEQTTEPTGDLTGDAHLTAAGVALFKNKGATGLVDGNCNIDPDGNVRGSTGAWSIGVFELASNARDADLNLAGKATKTNIAEVLRDAKIVI